MAKQARHRAFEEVRNRFCSLERAYGQALGSNGHGIPLPEDRDQFLRDVVAFRRAANELVTAARGFSSGAPGIK